MPGYLGYDPEALDRLAAAMRVATAELVKIRCGDVDASVAMARVRAAQAQLEGTWLPIVTGLRGCVAMTGFTPLHLDGSDARTSEFYVLQGYGWQVVSDPAGRPGEDAGPVTASEARAIAALLSLPDAEELLDSDDELRWLRGRLEQILGDPALARDFRRNLDAPWALAIMGDVRFAAAIDGHGEATGHLDELIAATAAIAGAGRDESWVRDLVGALDPYAGALVVRALDVGGEALGQLCADVLQRWRNPDPERGPWPDSYTDQPTADLLFPLMVDDPAAARAFLLRAADDPGMVFASSNDRALVSGVLLAGTDPASTSAVDAGRIIVPILDWSARELVSYSSDSIGGAYDPADLLAPLVAPWLLYFGDRADDWGWSDADADDALAFVVRDAEAMEALITSFERWRASIREHPLVDDEERLDMHWLSEISTLMDQIQRAFEREQIGDATRRRGWVVLVDWAVEQAASKALSNVPLGDELAGPTADVVDGLLTRIGWLPPTVDTAAALAHAERSERVVTTAVIAVVAMVDQLTRVGGLPAGAIDRLDLSDLAADRDPRATRKRLIGFVDSLEDDCSPAAYNAMCAVVSEFLSASTARHIG